MLKFFDLLGHKYPVHSTALVNKRKRTVSKRKQVQVTAFQWHSYFWYILISQRGGYQFLFQRSLKCFKSNNVRVDSPGIYNVLLDSLSTIHHPKIQTQIIFSPDPIFLSRHSVHSLEPHIMGLCVTAKWPEFTVTTISSNYNHLLLQYFIPVFLETQEDSQLWLAQWWSNYQLLMGFMSATWH